MRIIKNFITRDEATIAVMKSIDEILRKLDYNFRFDVLEFDLKDAFGSESDGSRATITVDHNNQFVKNKDEKAIKYLILYQLFKLAVEDKLDKEVPDIIKNILINREIVKNSYGDMVSYFLYLSLMSSEKEIKHVDDFLKTNVFWLSFSVVDEFNRNFFKKLVKKFNYSKDIEVKTRKIIRSLDKDLWKEKNLSKSLKLLE